MRSSILGVLFVAVTASAQVITLPAGPVVPGSTLVATLTNNTNHSLVLPCNLQGLWMQHSEGGLIVDQVSCVEFLLPSGASTPVSIGIPASGPGSSGSVILRSLDAAVRLDVGTPSSSFPAIHPYPALTNLRFVAHALDFWAGAPIVQWAFANTGSVTHVFSPGDTIRIFSPGGTLVLATMSLAGVSLPPQLESTLMVPLAGLPLAPYTVETTWLDPATNVVMTQRHGIQPYYGHADLNLPGGHVIPAGGVLPVQVGLISFPVPSAPLYAFCVGVLPGSTPLPGVASVPLVLDAAVTASLTDGIGGLLVNNIGSATLAPPHALSYAGIYSAYGIGVTHPGAAFSGLTVRGAIVAYDPATGQFAASQAEDLLVQ